MSEPPSGQSSTSMPGSSRIGSVASSCGGQHVARAPARRSSPPGRCPARSRPAAPRSRSSARPARRRRDERERRHGDRRAQVLPSAQAHPLDDARDDRDHDEAEPGRSDPGHDVGERALGLAERGAAPREPAVRDRARRRLAHAPEPGDEQRQPRRGAPTARCSPAAPSDRRARSARRRRRRTATRGPTGRATARARGTARSTRPAAGRTRGRTRGRRARPTTSSVRSG